MAIASVSTITSASQESWQNAAELGLARARQTLRGITGIKILEEKARVEDGTIVEYLVTMQVIFLLEEASGTGS
ncbi:MAG: dodecin domain-containing protein [Deltaproteobacteria bacterium]|nr:dodecin domain-containing protein [Deltaproteobacteria bacterium]